MGSADFCVIPSLYCKLKTEGRGIASVTGTFFHGQGHGDGCDCFLEIHFWSVLHLMRGRLAQKLAEIYLGCYIESKVPNILQPKCTIGPSVSS